MKKIAVSGGKGGVGKSVVSANLALALTNQGYRVVLFDADLQLANIDVMLGITATYNLQHVVTGQMELVDIFADGPHGLRVATGGSAINGLMNAGPKRMATFLSQLDDLRRTTDFIVFDTGAGIDTRVMTFLRLADQVVLVTTPDPTSVTDAYATVKVLMKKDFHAQIGVLVNQVTSDAEAKNVFGALNGISRQYLGMNLDLLGSIRADMAVLESVRKRKPLLAQVTNSPAALDFESLAERIARPTGLMRVA